MRAMTALIKREFLEHRGSFFYAPIVVLTLLTLAVLYGAVTGDISQEDITQPGMPSAVVFYQIAIVGTFMAWSVYLMVGLFFYCADSFSADRRNNALLFWKSMPQSDLKVLTSKALSSITLFPALIAGFAFITAAIAYVIIVILSTRASFLSAPNLIEAISIWIQMSIAGVVMLILSVLWYAPFFAWVAGLSTLFQRWSIPLAFLIPGAVVLIEYLNNIGGLRGGRPIAEFLAWRFESPFGGGEEDFRILVTSDNLPWRLIGEMFSRIDWLQLGIGLIFTAAIVWLASEYRRRRIEA